ncbi:hypothetical protein D3C81_2005870 [compost metagenome]
MDSRQQNTQHRRSQHGHIRRKSSHTRFLGIIAEECRGKRADYHQTFNPNVDHTGFFRKNAAQGRQNQRRGKHQGDVDNFR